MRVVALTWVPWDRAMFCLDCEVVFDGAVCPACGSEVFHPLHAWLNKYGRGRCTGELASVSLRPVAAPPEASLPLEHRDGSSSTERKGDSR